MWVCKECGREDIRLRKETVEFWDCDVIGLEEDFIFDDYKETYVCRNFGTESIDIESIAEWEE
ncbi:MAG: hypothetical protein ACRCZH_05690 [Cetobacterium sp.]